MNNVSRQFWICAERLKSLQIFDNERARYGRVSIKKEAAAICSVYKRCVNDGFSHEMMAMKCTLLLVVFCVAGKEYLFYKSGKGY